MTMPTRRRRMDAFIISNSPYSTILSFALLILISTKNSNYYHDHEHDHEHQYDDGKIRKPYHHSTGILSAVGAFVLPGAKRIHGISERAGSIIMRQKITAQKSSPSSWHLWAVQQDQEQEQQRQSLAVSSSTFDSNNNEYKKLRLQAERMRLEAEKMDADLTLQKITVLEKKLSNDAWLKKQKGQTVKDLYEKLRRLQTKIERPLDSNNNKKQDDDEIISSSSVSTTSSHNVDDSHSKDRNGREDDSIVVQKEKKYTSSSSSNNSNNNNRNIPPIAGFDDIDLDLYIPIAKDITKMVPNATLEKRIELFRDAPELQAHFKEKIQNMLLGPLEDMQKLETLKQNYFDSSSSKEREVLLKQIKQLEKKQDETNIAMGEANNDDNSAGGIAYSDSIKIPTNALPPLLDVELEERYETIKALPDILVAVYLQRNGLYDMSVSLSTINVDIGSERGSGGGVVNTSKANNTSTEIKNDDNKYKDYTKSNKVVVGEEEQAVTTTDIDTSSFDLYESLKLAIQLDYYDLQLQLLDQARNIQPMTDDIRADFALAFRSLPVDVRKRFVGKNLGIDTLTDTILTSDEDDDMEKILNEILKPDDFISPFLQIGSLMDKKVRSNVLVVGNGEGGGVQNQEQPVAPPEYNDVEFIDRSRYLEEFFPSIALLEEVRPTQEDVDLFVTECLAGANNKPFMVTSKPERVIGGYYIRGKNQLLNDINEKDKMTAVDMLVQKVYQRLQSHPSLKDKIEFYYILDPSPPSDEEMELGFEPDPIFVVTSKDADTMYKLSAPLTKSFVTVLGFVSSFLFSVGSCVLNPKISNEIEKALDNASSSGFIDVQWFYDLCLPLYFSMLGILFAHELGHRIAASYYKFEIGLPNVIPSLITGLAGSITPIKSPPPNNKALFDFSIAGPLAGLTVSLSLLFVGLQLTQQMSLYSNLPVLPVDLARASSLGGGMIQYFLGKYSLFPDQGSGAFVELHPFAISGLIGCLINALALLPLGHTDGGRISLAMFGRRGAFVTKLFTTVILCAAGLFGLDNVNILILYVIFTLTWQRELDSPIRNEVDELDFTRGLLGITSAILVGLILIPMTT